MMLRPLRFVPLLVALAIGAPLVAQDHASHTASDLVDVASEAGTFTTLLAAAEAAGLVETLRGEGPFTIFAPTDDAFASLPEGAVEALLADPAALRSVLLYHVVHGRISSEQVVGSDGAETVEGSSLRFSRDGDAVQVDEAQVIAVDIAASNGVIHVIDAVLIPADRAR
jgi:uncharacterized surface protein with fasciclin (FAS1) repeats